MAVLIDANAEGYTVAGAGWPTMANFTFTYWAYRDTTAVQGLWCWFSSSPYVGAYGASGAGGDYEHFSSQGTHVFRTMPVTTWMFGAIAVNGSTRTSYYADEGATTLTAYSTGAWSSSTAQFSEGSIGFVNYFGDSSRCKIAHFRWWGATLSQSELEAELVSATAVRTSNLAGEYRFANGALTTDSSGNGRTLTTFPSSSPTFSADPTFPSVSPRRRDRLIRPRGARINSTFY
jgi:hypothetical protein